MVFVCLLSDEGTEWSSYCVYQPSMLLPFSHGRLKTHQSSKTEKMKSVLWESSLEKLGCWTSELISSLPWVKLGVRSLPNCIMLHWGWKFGWEDVLNLPNNFSECGFIFTQGAGDFQLDFDFSKDNLFMYCYWISVWGSRRVQDFLLCHLDDLPFKRKLVLIYNQVIVLNFSTLFSFNKECLQVVPFIMF